jgi:hypothetical protein
MNNSKKKGKKKKERRKTWGMLASFSHWQKKMC